MAPVREPRGVGRADSPGGVVREGKMTRRKALERLAEIAGMDIGDPENAHYEADRILCEFLKGIGYRDIVAAYEAVEPKWYA